MKSARVLDHSVARRSSVKRPAAGQQLPQGHGQGIQVAAAVEDFGARRMGRVARLQLLRRHVRQAAAKKRCWVGSFQLGTAADIEVDQLGNALGGKEHIGRLDVPVQHAVVVGVGERRCQPRPHPAHHVRPAHACQLVPQRRAGRWLLAPALQLLIQYAQQPLTRALGRSGPVAAGR